MARFNIFNFLMLFMFQNLFSVLAKMMQTLSSLGSQIERLATRPTPAVAPPVVPSPRVPVASVPRPVTPRPRPRVVRPRVRIVSPRRPPRILPSYRELTRIARMRWVKPRLVVSSGRAVKLARPSATRFMRRTRERVAI